jgi:hypothetical protein
MFILNVYFGQNSSISLKYKTRDAATSAAALSETARPDLFDDYGQRFFAHDITAVHLVDLAQELAAQIEINAMQQVASSRAQAVRPGLITVPAGRHP